MFTLFSSRHIEGLSKSTNIWRLHTRLDTFARNISTDISTLGQPTHLKLGEQSSLFIVYNVTMSWPYPVNGFFKFYFLLRDNEHTLQLTNRKLVKSSRSFHGLISQGNIPNKSSYEGFRTDSSANGRLRVGLSTLVRPFTCRSQTFLSVQSPTEAVRCTVSRSIPLASLKVSLIVANAITAEQRAFAAGFQAVL